MTVKDYPGDGIVVHWDSEVCIHSGNCASGLSAVFRPSERPWIRPEGASADDIAATIDTCPSGALRYTRANAAASSQESAVAAEGSTPTTSQASTPAVVITVGADGPYLVKGPVEIRNATGEVIETLTKAALCRCGASETKPFCDGSHKRIGFTAP